MSEIRTAAKILAGGGLVAFPTETVYGLGADASNETALWALFAAKARPIGRALTVHLGADSAPERWAVLDARARMLAETCWPGPLTLVLPRQPDVLDLVTGGQDTVGLRVPNHPLALQLLDAFGGGVAAPSANRSGGLSPTTAAHVREELGDVVDFILDGGTCPLGVESTVLSLVGAPQILRQGALSRARLEALLGETVTPAIAARAPFRTHTPLVVAATGLLEDAIRENSAVLARSRPQRACAFTELESDPAACAQTLYAVLRALDAGGYDRIVVEEVPEDPSWDAVRHRLEAASTSA